jgi:hypothetical protein
MLGFQVPTTRLDIFEVPSIVGSIGVLTPGGLQPLARDFALPEFALDVGDHDPPTKGIIVTYADLRDVLVAGELQLVIDMACSADMMAR